MYISDGQDQLRELVSLVEGLTLWMTNWFGLFIKQLEERTTDFQSKFLLMCVIDTLDYILYE